MSSAYISHGVPIVEQHERVHRLSVTVRGLATQLARRRAVSAKLAVVALRIRSITARLYKLPQEAVESMSESDFDAWDEDFEGLIGDVRVLIADSKAPWFARTMMSRDVQRLVLAKRAFERGYAPAHLPSRDAVEAELKAGGLPNG